MYIIIAVLVTINIYQVLKSWSKEAEYLGEKSNLKIQIKEKDREIEELKNKISFLKTAEEYYKLD